MCSHWVSSSTGLPHEGEQIQFVLDGREVAMNGTYTQQTFRSHWSNYDVARVRRWRSADPDSSVAASARFADPTGRPAYG